MKINSFIIALLSIIIVLSLSFVIREKITGYQVMSTHVVISIPTPNMCNITFAQGWNLVSFPCIDQDTDVTQFFANTSFQYDTIRAYDTFDTNDPWKSYNPNLPSWVVQDTSLSRKEGYWVYVEDNENLAINSSLGTPSVISLAPGWNLIGYPSNTIRKSNDTFSQIVPDFQYVYLYNATDTADKWKLYKLNSTFPGIITLNYTAPNFGYWIYMTNYNSLIIT